jgi:hypothetical protein
MFMSKLKELKPETEKFLKNEFKEKPEKLEKNEKREFPEKFFDKSPKEIVEGGQKLEEGAGTAAAKSAELKQKELEKIKPEKEFPDKIHKEIEKIKPEKEFEKFHKEIEKIKPEKEFPEKFHFKSEFEKPSAETQFDPGPLFKRTGSAEDRINELEDAVQKLTHFIGVDLRPDLSTGALKGEPDQGTQGGGQGPGGGEAKTDDKKKPK